VQHKWAIDIDPVAAATYKRNFPAADVFAKDVKNVKFKDLKRIDGLAFGFPCNDFSIVGEQRGVDGAYGPLYSHGLRAIRHFRPKFFVAENVGGIRSANAGKALSTIISELERTGYTLTSHLFEFEKYSVPQRRHRVLIVGFRSDLEIRFAVPTPHSIILTAKQALECPPIPSGAANQEYTKQSSAVVARLKALKPGQNAFAADLPIEHRLNIAGVKISQIYRRLLPNEPSYTVTGSGGGGTHVYHWSEPRALTNRERARLQSFPDSFIFEGGKEAVRRQIGMAVPPLGARAIFKAVIRTLLGRPYTSVPASLGAKYDSLLTQTELL
jgi:DNA (cytosine-5)-methyltransferase 1